MFYELGPCAIALPFRVIFSSLDYAVFVGVLAVLLKKNLKNQNLSTN